MEQETFLEAVASTSTKHVGLAAFGQYSGRFISKQPMKKSIKVPTGLRTLYQSTSSSPEQISLVEESTRTQSCNLIWQDQRIGRITSSTAHNVLHTNQANPAPSLITKICQPGKPIKNIALSWGNQHENKAFLLYSSNVIIEHKKCTTRKTTYLFW